MDEGSIGLIVLFLTGSSTSIVVNLVIKKLWIAVILSAIIGSVLFHLFAYIYGGPDTIMFLPISLVVGAIVVSLLALVIGLVMRKNLERQWFERRPNQGCVLAFFISVILVFIGSSYTFGWMTPLLNLVFISLSLITGVVAIGLRIWVHRRRKK